jgi:hypothetical protein
MLERSLSAQTIGTTQNLASNIDPALFSRIGLGQLEIREQFNYDPTTKVLTSNLFAASPTSNMPTDLSTIPTGPPNQNLGGYTVAVDNVYFSCSPVPNVLMVGRITSTGANNLFGANLNGAPVAVSFGYSTANPPEPNNVVVVIAGVVAGYSAGGAGTIGLTTPPVTPPPGSNGGGPVIVVVGGFDQITSARQIVLSAAGTQDPGGTQVSYMWTQPTPGNGCPDNTGQTCTLRAAIKDANSSNPTVSFEQGKGDYLFMLTATNAAGAASSQMIRIRYVGVI